jgi:hypothetical protein
MGVAFDRRLQERDNSYNDFGAKNQAITAPPTVIISIDLNQLLKGF